MLTVFHVQWSKIKAVFWNYLDSFFFSFSHSFRNGDNLGELLVGDCEDILSLIHLITIYSFHIIHIKRQCDNLDFILMKTEM